MADISKNPPKRWWNFRPEFEGTEEAPGSPVGVGIPSPMGIRQMSMGRSTGLGPNGTLEKEKPTAIRSFAEHEGEYVVNADKVKKAGGPGQINAAVAAIAKPGQPGQAKADAEQEKLAREEVRGLAGYRSGGMVIQPRSKSFKDTFAPSGSPRMQDQTAMKKKERVLGLRGYTHGGTVTAEEAFTKTSERPTPVGSLGQLNPTDGKAVTAEEAFIKTSERPTPAESLGKLTPAPTSIGVGATPEKLAPVSTGLTIPVDGGIPADGGVSAGPPPVKSAPPTTTLDTTTLKPAEIDKDISAAPPTTGFIGQGLKALSEAARGESKAFRTMTNRMMNRIAGETAAGQMALNQRLTQMGMGSGAMLAAGANYIQGQTSHRDTLAGVIAESGQKLATQAARDLVSQSLAVEKFAFDQKKYEDTKELVDFNAALLTKDMDEITRAYKAMTGRDFDPEELNWWMDHAKDMAEGTKYLNEWDVANDSYQSLLSSDPEKAKEQWALMKNDPRFANFMKGMVEPDWDKVQAGWDEDRHDSIMGNLAAQITDDVPLWQLTDQIDELLETNTGKTVEEIATEQGITVDEVRQNEYDRIEDQSSPIAQALKFYEGAFEQYFDTPEERRIAKETISEMLATGGIVVNEDGSITTDTDKLMLAWNNPKTQHIFDSRLSTTDKDIIDDLGAGASQADIDAERTSRQNTKDSREAYLEAKRTSGEDPASFDDWYKAALTGMGDGLTGDALIKYVDEQQPVKLGTTVVEGVSEDVSQTTESPTGFMAGGKFVEKDADDNWVVYDYDRYKTKTEVPNRTYEDVLNFANQGDSDAINDLVGIVLTDGVSRWQDVKTLSSSLLGQVGQSAPSIKQIAHDYRKPTVARNTFKNPPTIGKIYNYDGKVFVVTSTFLAKDATAATIAKNETIWLEGSDGVGYKIVAGNASLQRA